MPKSKTKSDEIDDLVDDLDELDEDEEVEDDEEEEDDEEDDDEDPDEAPKTRKSKSKSKKSKKAKKEKVGIGTAEVAEAAGIESRQLRAFLRKAGYQPRDEREGRYVWSSLNDPEVKAILKRIKKGEVADMNAEKLADLKKKKGKKKSSSKKKATSKKKK